DAGLFRQAERTADPRFSEIHSQSQEMRGTRSKRRADLLRLLPRTQNRPNDHQTNGTQTERKRQVGVAGSSGSGSSITFAGNVRSFIPKSGNLEFLLKLPHHDSLGRRSDRPAFQSTRRSALQEPVYSQ